MTGPRRLKDDPDFKWETGCDLADEQMALPIVDLPSIKAALMAKLETAAAVGDGVPAVRPGPTAASAFKPVTGMVVAAAVVFGAYWLGVKTGTELEVASPETAVEKVAPAMGEGPVVLPAPPDSSTERLPTERLPTERLPTERLPTERQPTERQPTELLPTELLPTERQPPMIESQPAVIDDGFGTQEPDAGTATPIDAATAAVAATPSDGSIAYGGTSDAADASDGDGGAAISVAAAPDLADSTIAAPSAGGISDAERALALYTEANQALRSGHAAEARLGFERYLDEFPDRYMSAEASLGLLHAQFATGDATATEALAGQLQQLPALTDKRSEILRLRAEALVLLDRCAEALLVVDALSTREGAPVRRACRQQRKGDTD